MSIQSSTRAEAGSLLIPASVAEQSRAALRDSGLPRRLRLLAGDEGAETEKRYWLSFTGVNCASPHPPPRWKPFPTRISG